METWWFRGPEVPESNDPLRYGGAPKDDPRRIAVGGGFIALAGPELAVDPRRCASTTGSRLLNIPMAVFGACGSAEGNRFGWGGCGFNGGKVPGNVERGAIIGFIWWL